MVRTRLLLSVFGESKNPHGGKEAWSEPDFDLAYFGGSKNPHGGKEAWSEPDFDLAYFGGSKNPHGGKKEYGPNQTSTQPILVDRKIHTVEKDRRFKEHFGLITKRKFSCLPP